MKMPMENCHVITTLLLIGVSAFLKTTEACKGCVELDEITFHRVPKMFNYTLVKFDIAFPYGDKHEAFSQLALKLQTVEPIVHDLLFALVGVKDYGDRDNADLARKYEIDEKSYPGILLLKNGELIARFPASKTVSVENMKAFIRENTLLYIGLSGCIKEFDEIVADYTNKEKKEQERAIKSAKKLIETKNDNKNYTSAGNIYVSIMEKTIQKGSSFIKDEEARIEKLLKGKISATKKQEMETKLNILKSFESKEPVQKPVNEEL